MKKITAITFFVLPSFAFAQFNKGQIFLGGTMSASLTSNDLRGTAVTNNYGNNNKINSFSVSPVFGYLLNQRIAIGGGIGYSSSFSESNFYQTYYDNNNNLIYVPAYLKTISNSINVSAFSRYYMTISNSIYFALHGQINFARGNSKSISFNNGNVTSQETTLNTPNYVLGTTIRPVLIFFPSPKWGIEASIGSIGYSVTRYLPNVYSTNTFTLSAGTFSFGLAYYFKRKSE